jgi:hypothetical protein
MNRLKEELEHIGALVGIRHAVLTEDGAVLECDFMTWARWLEKNRGHRIIQQEELAGGYFLSTVFLGLDHGFGGKPLWFETMIFEPPTSQGNACFCERYSTLAQALAGHEEAKRALKR